MAMWVCKVHKRHYQAMENDKTIGQKLLELKERAGTSMPRGRMSLDEIANRIGKAGRSSVQSYFKVERTAPLAKDIAERLAHCFEGLGSPKIQREEVLALAAPEIVSNVTTTFGFEGASNVRMAKDLPVYGAALGADKIVDGEAIELTTLNRAEILEYRERPPALNGKNGVYGLYVQGSSIEPAFDDGDLIIAQKNASISSGDFVVVYLRPKGDADDGETATNVLVKRLVRRNSQFIELRQYQPDITFQIPFGDVLRMDKALRLKDILT